MSDELTDFLGENFICGSCRERFSNGDSCPACGSYLIQENFISTKETTPDEESVWYTMRIGKDGRVVYEFPKAKIDSKKITPSE
ncbi:MAG: hypothetical protein V1851_00855 [Patescibacteria group bacterium]